MVDQQTPVRRGSGDSMNTTLTPASAAHLADRPRTLFVARERRRRNLALVVTLGLLAAATVQSAEAVWIYAKAGLAQVLLERAWQQRMAGDEPVKPWPWADTWPVARLTSSRHGVKLIVLDGATGAALPFGPGHMSASAFPGDVGNTVLSAHRDTHFSFLEQLEMGDQLGLQTPDGRRMQYTVISLQVVDARTHRIALATEDARLTLVTCYPFGSPVPNGPLRYVVTAVRNEYSI